MPLHDMLYTSLNSLFRGRSSVPQPILAFSPPRFHLNSFPYPLVHFFVLLYTWKRRNFLPSFWRNNVPEEALIIFSRLTLKSLPIRNVKQMCVFCSACTIISNLCLLPIETVFSVKEGIIGDVVVD